MLHDDGNDAPRGEDGGRGPRARESLRQSQEQFETLVANVRDYAIFLLDARGCVISWNAGARELKGYAAEEIIGRHFSAFYPPEEIERGWPARELAVASAEGHFEDEGWRLRKDGTRFWANVVITALRDESGGTRGFMKITRDLTERRRAEERLRTAHDELERRVRARTAELERTNERLQESQRRFEVADQRKDQFLAVLSHELRNPLAPVRIAIEIFRRAHLTDARLQKSVEIVDRQVAHMTRLVDDLLDISRITSGKLRLRRICLDLTRLVQTVAEDHRGAAEASGVSLTLELPRTPVFVSGDEVRLSQALGNVVSNAIKFTPSGGSICVGLEREGEEAIVVIADTGVGIRADLLQDVFEPFTQDDLETSRNAGGLGLGLALVRGLVEMHGGTITADSAGPGDGATFTMRVPITEPEDFTEAREGARNPTKTPRRILVIEDNVDAAETLAMLLGVIGHEVEVAYTGASGIAAAQRLQPELVICDIGLTDISGLEVAPRLRQLLPAAYLIASTGYGQHEDRRRTREAGFHLHLTKPMDPAHLERVIDELPPRPGSPVGPPQA